MKVGFEDAVRGVQTKIRLNRRAARPSAADHQGSSAGEAKTCPTPGIRQGLQQRGHEVFRRPPACGGRGPAGARLRMIAGGRGRGRCPKRSTRPHPGRSGHGSKVRIPRKAMPAWAAVPGGSLHPDRDLVPSALSGVEGMSLHVKVPITVPEATLGAENRRPDAGRTGRHPQTRRGRNPTAPPIEGQGALQPGGPDPRR